MLLIIVKRTIEAEFMAAESVFKVPNNITSILKKLGFRNEGTTKIYFENMEEIIMGKSNSLTTRDSHIFKVQSEKNVPVFASA